MKPKKQLTSFATLEAARAHAAELQAQQKPCACIVRIEPTARGEREGVKPFVVVAVGVDVLSKALRSRPIPQINRIIALEVDFTAELYAKTEARMAEKNALLQQLFPGLVELRAARRAHDEWYYQYNRAIYAEATPPTFDGEDPRVVARRFPQAALYLQAEAYAQAANDCKSAAGSRAIARMEAGENPPTVIADMESQWAAAASRLVENS